MADRDDFQALENISNEVDNSQVKILISSHCMKAQAFLLNKLNKQAERQKELCKFIGSSNLKLETEIKFAEQEIKSLNIAIETIKLANIELNKEHLLSKERKAEIFERTKNGKKKYDDLWIISKKRYENIPIVKKVIETKNKNQTIQANISAFNSESKHLVNEIKIKRKHLEAADRARIIELANFLLNERTNMLTKINENNVKIKEVLNELETLEREEIKCSSNELYAQPLTTDGKQAGETINDSTLEVNYWSTLSKNTEKDTLVLPKLHLQNNDFDILSIKLDQINKVDSMKRPISSLSDLKENPHKIHKTEDGDNKYYISSYFDIPLNNSSKKEYQACNKNYSEKKLIHILEDIKLDKNETYKIIKKIEVTQFQRTKYISSKNMDQCEKICNTQNEPVQSIKSLETEEIDEIKSKKTREENVVDPPSQFLDVSQSSQEKKTVSFNIPMEIEMPAVLEADTGNRKEIDIAKSQDKLLNNSTASDDSYTTIKDKILKKHNLDLSPQFVYSKSSLMHKQYEDKTTSKFFESEHEAIQSCNINENDFNKNLKHNEILKYSENKSNLNEDKNSTIDENIVVSSPKKDIKTLGVPVAGFLFNHGPQGITDSLNLSISTTGFEDNEDFPHCIDSSIMLSPKAEITETVPGSQNNEVLSQEVPNFLAGFRKTALTFFGNATNSSTKPDSGDSQSGGFNFAFGNEEKKGRGGFFSMFH